MPSSPPGSVPGALRKGITPFVYTILEEQTACQAQLARCVGNHEAASKRLSRVRHHPRLDPNTLAEAILAQALQP